MLAVIGGALVVVLVLLVALGVGAVRVARWATTGEWLTPQEQRVRESSRILKVENAVRRAAMPSRPVKPWWVSQEVREAAWREQAEMNFVDYWAMGGPYREDDRLVGDWWPGARNR